MAIRGGFQIAEAYVELILDKDTAKQQVRELPRDLGPELERAGQRAGEQLGNGIVRDAGGRLRNARGQLATDAEIALAGLDPVAERRGNEAGGKLAQGLRQGVIRNSPLIVAAVAAALAAGAPVAISSATLLFGAIAAVAAAQGAQVRSVWSSLWEQIKQSTQADAQVLDGVFARLGNNLGATLAKVRPLLRDAFESAAPILDKLFDSIIRGSENALPGLVRAVQASGPAVAGLGSLIESLGTGISDFFDQLSDPATASAAGKSFVAIGDVVGRLLPILGEFLGIGVQLAGSVLPTLATVLGAVGGALDVMAPALPAVVAGFAGFKIVGAISGQLTVLAQKLAFASYGTGALAGAAGRLSPAFSSAAMFMGRATIPLAIALAAMVSNMQHAEQQAEATADALLKGGKAARTAAADIGPSIAGMNAGWVDGVDSVMQYADSLPVVGTAAKWVWDAVTTTTEEAAAETEDSLRRMIDAMNPLQRAQAEVTYWTNELASAQGDASFVIQDLEGNTVTAAEAQYMLAAASETAARLQAELDRAASGMSRTLEQAAEAADQLLTALESLNGSQLTQNEATRAFEQAIDDANAALAENGRTLDVTTQAGRDNGAALDEMAASAQEVADSIYRSTGNYGDFRASLERSRGILYDQARAFGMSDAAARAYVDSVLQIPDITAMDIETNADTARAQLEHIAGVVAGLPPGHTINVGVVNEQAILALSQMGYIVTGLPDGTVTVTATDHVTPLTDEILTRLGLIDTTTATATIDADNSGFTDIASSTLDVLGIIDGTVATPTVGADTWTFTTAVTGVLDALNLVAGQQPTPVIDANAAPAQTAIDVTLDDLLGVGAQHPTPVIDANPAPAQGAVRDVLGAMGIVAAQTPTPVMGANPGPLMQAINSSMGALGNLGAQRPTPVASLTDLASGAASAVRNAIFSIPLSRTTTITTIQRTVLETLRYNGPYQPGAATGGQVGAVGRRAVGRSDGGRVEGPGGPTDDMVGPFRSRLADLWLSDDEWVIRGASSTKYGDTRMAAVNAGIAEILLPGERLARGLAGGGPAAPPPAALASAAGGIHVHGDIVVRVGGGDASALLAGGGVAARRLALGIRQALIDLDREGS